MKRGLIVWTRRFKREKAMVAFLVASLAVALGSAVVALTLNRSVLWRDLPFPDASRLVKIETRGPALSPRWLSLPEFRALADAPPSPFDAIAGYTSADFTALSEPGLPPQALLATMVSAQFLDVLRIRPALGQVPAASAYSPDGERVVLLSHDLWQRRYRGAADIVGRSVRLSGPEYLPGSDGLYRIAGVLPRDLWLFWKRADLVVPLRVPAVAASDANAERVEHLVSRMSPDATLEAARAMGAALTARVTSAGATSPPAAVTVESLRDAHFRAERPQLQVLLAIAAIVVLLSLMNIVIGATAQAVSRRRETAVRIAIGGGAWRLFMEAVRENAITATVAGAAGAALGIWLTGLATTAVPPQWLSRVPGEAASVRADGMVALSLVGILVAVTLGASLAMHLLGRHRQPWSLLGTTIVPPTRSSRVLGSGLVAAEIALCVCAVGTGSVLVQQLFALRRVDLGIVADRTSAVWVNLSPSKFATDESRVAHYDAILRRVGDIPDVEAAGGIDLTFQFAWRSTRVRTAGVPDSGVTALSRAATEGYLRASGMDLVAGRWFDARDRRGGAAVAVVSESLARALWAERPAIGREIRLGDDNEPARVATVVGVVTGTRHAPYTPPDRIVYRPVAQAPPPWLYLVVKTRSETPDMLSALGGAVWSVDPDQPIDGPWPMTKWVDDRTAHLRFVALLTGVLALVGAVLAAAGLYGLTAFWVSESTRDLGIRRAIGAGDGAIARWFGMRCALVVLPGVAVGAFLLFSSLRLVSAGIQGVQPPSWPQILWGVAAVLICSACGAAVPLRRALAADAAALMR